MFYVQVGKGRGSYKNRYVLEDLGAACFWYEGLNIGNGYKKRLLDPGGNVIARYIS